MAERQLPKLHTRVRFPSPAPSPCRTTRAFRSGQSHIALCWSLDRVGAALIAGSSILRSPTSSVFVHSGYCGDGAVRDAIKKKPALLRAFFALPASVSASAEAEGYARAAITIAAIVRPRSVAVASIIPRSVTVASIIWSVVTIAVMVVAAPVSMARADVG